MTITRHAAERFMSRAGARNMDEAEKDLRELARVGRPLRSLPLAVVPMKGETYLRAGSWVLVVARDTLLTVYRYEGKWQGRV